MPDNVLAYIAENIVSNIRELEGALNRVVAYASLSNSNLDIDLAKECLNNLYLIKRLRILTLIPL